MRQIIQIFGKTLALTAKQYIHSLANSQQTQQKIQKQILQKLSKSDYGKSLSIYTLKDWQRIPIVEYHQVEHWILKQQATNQSLLTNEPVIFYEKTSGSRGAAKFIPYTKSLRRSFNQMFCVWAYDLIVHGPKFSTGKIYFCISPQLGNGDTQIKDAAISSSGLEDDSQYLDNWLRWFLSPFLVSPVGLNRLQNAEEFKHKLSQALLLAEDLEIISIWSPTFLKVILDYIQTNSKQLAEELGDRISPQRRQFLIELQNQVNTDIAWQSLWPELKLISCWDSANAADGAGFLRFLFPNVLVQGKGLLATEAPMTIPLIAAKGCVPILDQVFFEFEDQAGKIYLLHELEQGKDYEMIISQKGGLYRYRIGDRIRVTHFYQKTPCLEFIGRTQEISDLVGEKLHSEFVREVLNDLPLTGTFFKSLVPVKQPKEHYIFLVDHTTINPQELASKLDTALQQSPQYRHARLVGQLNPVRVLVCANVYEIITSHKTRSGKKWGDLKHEILVTKAIDQKLLNELEKASQDYQF